MIFPLDDVVYDKRARYGCWCILPYPNHPNGCPNVKKHYEMPDGCCNKAIEDRDFLELSKKYERWTAIIEPFDLRNHHIKMRRKHGWTSRLQLRNRRHWQNSVESKLHKEAKKYAGSLLCRTVILDIPEANGVNVYATLAKVGVFLKADPDLVYKVMLVGKAIKKHKTGTLEV